MSILVRQIKPVMLVSGALTLTMAYAPFAPQAAAAGMFGEPLAGRMAELVIRNWGALIAIGGGMLLWGAFHPAQRAMALLAVGGSKLVFVLLTLSVGQEFLTQQIGLAALTDAVWVCLFAAYLVETGLRPGPAG